MGATWTLWVCTCVATWPQRLMGELAWRCALLLGRAAPINAHSGSETWPAHSFLSRISSQGCQPPANTSSHSNGTYKGLWALTGMSVACVCVWQSWSAAPHPLIPSSPSTLTAAKLPAWTGGKKELNKGDGQTFFQKWPPPIINPSIHPSPRGQECAHWG